jgi:hypothetical protein
MSAPVATPQPQAQRAPRRSGRKAIRPGEVDGASTPAPSAASEPQPNHSAAAGHPTKNSKSSKGQQRKASNAVDKQQADLKHVHNHHHDKVKATPTPMKPAAYAGSTFQQSPAASALPLPSFYSRSLPTTSSMPMRAAIPEPVSPPQTDTPTGNESPSKPEATPCDFLFQAARKARANSRADSPAIRSGHLSVPNGSPASRSPAPRETDPMFPFELDGASAGEDGSPFATPYKDRIEALRSTSSGGKSMDDNERKAKTEALKKLLMKSSTQENNNTNTFVEINNPFNARAPHVRTAAVAQGPPQARATSNPSTPLYTHDNPGHYTPPNFPPVGYPFPTPQTQTPKRPNSSRLRHVYGAQSEPEYPELSSDSAVTPPSSSRKHTNYHAAPPRYNEAPYANHPQMPTHRAKPSAQQLEDDLRRVLKLDLTSRG